MSHLLTAARRSSKSSGAWAELPHNNAPPSQFLADGTETTRESYQRDSIYHNPNIAPDPVTRRAEHQALLHAPATNEPRTRDETTITQQNSEGAHPAQHNDIGTEHPAGDWRPYSLRPAFLGSMALVSLVLAITLAVLCWVSVKNNGLRHDTDTAGLLMARRYLPTILAVFFTQGLVIVANDIKRTEPFARLARSDDLDVKHTLLYRPKPWWSMIREGSVRQRNAGQIGWILVISSLATGMSILAVSALSSSLLASEPVVVRSTIDLQRFVPAPIALEPRQQVYFHTTSSFLFNASNSMWVSDDYVVSPFGATDLHNYPDFLPEGNWEMETKVLQMESSCKQMQFSGFEAIKRNATTEYYYPPGANIAYHSPSYNYFKNGFRNVSNSRNWQGFALDSEDGCHIQVLAAISSQQEHRIVRDGGLFWTNLSSSYITYDQWAKGRGLPVFSRAKEWSPSDTGLIFDFSDDCVGRNLIMVTTPWSGDNDLEIHKEDIQVRAELCTPQYFEAMTNVTASVTSDTRRIFLDEDHIRSHRVEVSGDLLDVDVVQQLTFGRDELGYLNRATALKRNLDFEGLSEALSAPFSFDIETMLHNSTLPDEAIRLSKRFFGELLISSMTEQQPKVLQSSKGLGTRIERRIVVVTEAAATLSVLLLLFSCYLLYLCFAGASRRRPLKLSSDPATLVGCGTYLQQNHKLSGLLGTAQAHRTQSDQTDFSESTQYLGHRLDKAPQVGVKGYTSVNEVKRASSQSWKPAIIKSWSICALFVAFILIGVAIIVLQNFASRQLLYRSAFIYRLDLRVFNARFSPQSVIATLLAVGVSIWWDAIDTALRTAQPFLSMSKSVTDVRYGAALSYQTSYWLWASARAVLNSHWLLSLVTFGTTLCQILIVSMAAMFERGPGIITTVAHVNSTYAARQSPLTYNHSTNFLYASGIAYSYQSQFLQDAMRVTTSDWLYSALDQITLDSQQPDWSRDGWSFTPVNLDSLPSIRNFSTSSPTSAQDDASSLPVVLVNSTLTTSALRARLQCEKVETETPSWFVKNEIDLFPRDNSTEAKDIRDRLRRAGYILPHTVFNGSEYETSVFSRTSAIQCCSNETDPEGRAAVGYWSQMNTSAWWASDPSMGASSWANFGPDAWPPNFAVKWIAGPTTTTNVTVYTNAAPSFYKIMQFKEVPPMAFLSCKPIIEKAEANIVLAHGTGQVLDFKILGELQAQTDPWAAHFRHANESDPMDTIATVSYGSYFLTQLLGASSIAPWKVTTGFYPPFDFENLNDDRFNIRDTKRGYNMDFMSYANLYQANMDPLVLLDTDLLLNYSQRTFQTFFQHFASQTGWFDGQLMAYQRATDDNADQVEVTTTQRIETLTMIPSATWLSMAIIALLVAILGILFVSLKVVYPHDTLRNNMVCLADMLALIEGSEGLLWFAERHDIDTLRESGLNTRLGWFKDRTGVLRWGVELVDAPGVEWVEKPEAFEMASSVSPPVATTSAVMCYLALAAQLKDPRLVPALRALNKTLRYTIIRGKFQYAKAAGPDRRAEIERSALASWRGFDDSTCSSLASPILHAFPWKTRSHAPHLQPREKFTAAKQLKTATRMHLKAAPRVFWKQGQEPVHAWGNVLDASFDMSRSKTVPVSRAPAVPTAILRSTQSGYRRPPIRRCQFHECGMFKHQPPQGMIYMCLDRPRESGGVVVVDSDCMRSNTLRRYCYLEQSAVVFFPSVLVDTFCIKLNTMEEQNLFSNISSLSLQDQTFVSQYGRGSNLSVLHDTVHGAFESIVDAHPTVVAAIYGDHKITYHQLDLAANRLAHHLISSGLRPKQRVCLVVQRSLEMLVGLLAILKAGCQYVPIDGGVASDQALQHIFEDTEARFILCLPKYWDKVRQFASRTAVVLELGMETGAFYSPLRPNIKVSTNDGIYAMYTSGSTGVPKGVDVKHSTMTNALLLEPGRLRIAVGSKVAQVLSISFAMGAWEMLGSLINGGTLYLRGSDWNATLAQVDTLVCTPSILSKYSQHDYPNIKTVVVAGEACSQSLADDWAQGRCFYNLLGSTEVFLFSAHKHKIGEPLSIGQPLPNTRCYILDDDGEPVPVGQRGTLWVGGKGVSKGYINLPLTTAEKFQPDRFANDGTTMYNFGNIVCWRADGCLESFGRMDDQVKIKGFRVELDGVTAVLEQFDGVVRATSLVIDGILHAFYTSSTTVDEQALDTFVRKQLPYYSVPERWIRVEAVPLNSNGKVDKTQLKALAAASSMPATDVKPTKPGHQRVDSAFDNVVAVREVVVPLPVIAQQSPRTSYQGLDLEKGVRCHTKHLSSSSVGTNPDDTLALLPDVKGSPTGHWLRHRGLIAYRWFLIPIVAVNIGVACWILNRGIKSQHYPLSYVATATAANLCASILIRSEPVINLLFTVFSSVPTWMPLAVRRICANVYHIGGIHVGCAIAAVIWFIVFTVGVSIDLTKGSDVRAISLAPTILTYLILVLLLSMTTLSQPTLRNKYHDSWESLHRFGGWTVLGLYWILVGLSTKDLNQGSGMSTTAAYLRNPSIWLIAAATLAIIFPWLFLRRVPVRSEVLSSHAVRLHFDSEVAPGQGVRLAGRPLGDWHGFATITNGYGNNLESNGKGYSVIVSRAGDFTGRCIDTAPTHIWRRGIPTCGVLRIASLFKSVVIVATGSGIGPCLSIFPYQQVAMRILWTAPNHQKTFGKSIVDDVRRRDPNAVIYNTRESGKPDMSLLTYRLYKDSGAEAVLVISNKRFTQQIVFDMEKRGIPAYGAIFDS
ncbi:hypothetical protein OPT61_g6806 [Boeremia exigua]|uniref:Uncharacterized protein n=1 Tax=Boeremia exigua TaxID=749465 RepID=A0ACC2I4R1_9PLEO|nr:hypothetical protein OPT61_g6806 [Boeremia exigua]